MPTPPAEHQFKPGQSGNPNGRPKKIPELDKLLAEVLGEEKDGITAAEAILKRLRQQAAAGNIRAAEVLLDRAYGKAKQSVEVSGVIDSTNLTAEQKAVLEKHGLAKRTE